MSKKRALGSTKGEVNGELRLAFVGTPVPSFHQCQNWAGTQCLSVSPVPPDWLALQCPVPHFSSHHQCHARQSQWHCVHAGFRVRYVRSAGAALKKCETPKWPLNEVSGSRAFCVLFGVYRARRVGHDLCVLSVGLKAVCVQFLSILAVLSVGRRHHKPPLRGGGASQAGAGPDRGASRPPPDRAKKTQRRMRSLPQQRTDKAYVCCLALCHSWGCAKKRRKMSTCFWRGHHFSGS